ncbi:MAG: tRNA pseudouridine(55) synthase TruB [Nitrospinae bacterium]|nr:tRNA pseudouridine(55) synthase TruB [Nitrospinota bacterium]
MDGIININKPRGITSFTTVSRVKHILGVKKAGHTGTLDPVARGVLPICIGKATKIAQSLMLSSKVYIAGMKLGIKTDTEDSSGKIIEQRRVHDVDEDKIKKIFLKYTGEIEQIPPMYSAMRFQGKRLYTLARKGISVERKPKKVRIDFIRLIDIKDDLVTFEVKTSPGTYIRTLCDSIGEELGCGAHMLELERIRVGIFKIEDSLSIEDLILIREEGRVFNILYSMDKVLSSLDIFREVFPKYKI